MYDNLKFKQLGLMHISPDILNRCRLNAGDVLGLYNPKGDGNCGWRASSVLINGNEEHYDIVKMLMMHALLDHREHYEWVLSKEGYDDRLTTLTHKGPITSERLWFDSLDCPMLLAEAYNRPVVIYLRPRDPNLADQSISGVTFLPIFSECHDNHDHINHAPVVLFLNCNHIQLIVIKDDAINRVIWPKIFPGYEGLVAKRGLSTSWLDLYRPRCLKF